MAPPVGFEPRPGRNYKLLPALATNSTPYCLLYASRPPFASRQKIACDAATGRRFNQTQITKKEEHRSVLLFLAPPVGFEPTTLRLTAGCSTAELQRNMKCGGDLSSRAVAHKVLSAQESLTSVFGMRTGGSSPPQPPQWLYNLDFHPRYIRFFSFSQQD